MPLEYERFVVLPASQAQLGADLYFDSSLTACSTKPSQAHVQSAAYKLSRAIHMTLLQRASRIQTTWVTFTPHGHCLQTSTWQRWLDKIDDSELNE